jgi:hypothetical protein
VLGLRLILKAANAEAGAANAEAGAAKTDDPA